MNEAEMERMQPDHGYAPGELPVDEATERERRRLLSNWAAVQTRRNWRLAWRAARKLGTEGRNLPFSIGGHLDEAVRMLEARCTWDWVEAWARVDEELRRSELANPDTKFPRRPFSSGPVGGRLP